jgi:hypothetical protein
MDNSASIIQKWWKKHISMKNPKKSIKKIQITKEEAEKSCNEWLGTENSPMREWLTNAIMDSRQHRDIGKVLAYVAESHVIKWLETKSGRPIKSIIGESYDGKTNNTKPSVRIQIKFRMNYWHCETTRRNCKKNAETNSTGHVAYKKDEFDILAIFKPSPTFGISGSTIRCIPISCLINPKKTDQLITNIHSRLQTFIPKYVRNMIATKKRMKLFMNFYKPYNVIMLQTPFLLQD